MRTSLWWRSNSKLVSLTLTLRSLMPNLHSYRQTPVIRMGYRTLMALFPSHQLITSTQPYRPPHLNHLHYGPRSSATLQAKPTPIPTPDQPPLSIWTAMLSSPPLFAFWLFSFIFFLFYH